MWKLLVLLVCSSVTGYRPRCDKKSISLHVQIPTYEFSVRLLDRISQEADGHFVFSPISTWLQLLALADGATGSTLNEIIRITKYYRISCLRKLVKEIFNSIDDESRVTLKHSSIIVIDNLLDIKHSFIRNVEKLKSARVLSENFKTISESAAKVNNVIKMDTNGTISETVDPHDFIRTVLLMIDVGCMKANWRKPFNPIYTKTEIFYSHEKIALGHVNMMHQIGYFHVSYVPAIDAQLLEIPFNDRLTMLLILPINGTAANLFWSMKKIRLSTMFQSLKLNRPKLVNIKLPRFKVTTDIDNMPELLYDMGVQRIFVPGIADLRKISDYKVYVSMMQNIVDIEVTEKGVSGNVAPDFLVAREDLIDNNMVFNHPFAYLIVDKITNVILFAGIYSDPSVY